MKTKRCWLYIATNLFILTDALISFFLIKIGDFLSRAQQMDLCFWPRWELQVCYLCLPDCFCLRKWKLLEVCWACFAFVVTELVCWAIWKLKLKEDSGLKFRGVLNKSFDSVVAEKHRAGLVVLNFWMCMSIFSQVAFQIKMLYL